MFKNVFTRTIMFRFHEDHLIDAIEIIERYTHVYEVVKCDSGKYMDYMVIAKFDFLFYWEALHELKTLETLGYIRIF